MLDTGIVTDHGLAEMPKSPPIPPNLGRPRRIEVLAFDGVQLLDVAGPSQVFATANEITTRAGMVAPYRLHLVAPGGSGVTSSAGVGLAAQSLPRASTALDTLIVAGGPGVARARGDRALVRWISTRAGQARRVASVCTGAFLLAEAGLLEGRRAVTHWAFCAELARSFPGIRVESDPIFVRDGPVWSSAGVTSGIDLALALVEEDHGRTLALAVARHLVVFLKRPGGQAQFSATLSLQAGEQEFGGLHDWMAAHLGGDLSVAALAAQAAMSERNFCRRYRAATGTTPAHAVERLRLEAARRLLADSTLPVKLVARHCGFGTEETMRRAFLRGLAANPSDYRTRFGT